MEVNGHLEHESTGARALHDDEDPPWAIAAPTNSDLTILGRRNPGSLLVTERHPLDVAMLRNVDRDRHQGRAAGIDAGLETEMNRLRRELNLHPLIATRRLAAPLDGDARRHGRHRPGARQAPRRCPFELALPGPATTLAPPHHPGGRPTPRPGRKERGIFGERRLDDQLGRRLETGRAGVAGYRLQPPRREIEDADRVDQRHQEVGREGGLAPAGIGHFDEKPSPAERRCRESRLGDHRCSEARIGPDDRPTDDLITGVERVGGRQPAASVVPEEVVATLGHGDRVDDPRRPVARPGKAHLRRATDIESVPRPLALLDMPDTARQAVLSHRLDLEHRCIPVADRERSFDDQLG